MADWSELPEDIIALFAKHLPAFVEEFVRFCCVCKSWRSAAMRGKRKVFAPWLMLSKLENDSTEDGSIRDCYNIESNEMLRLELPELGGKRCWGTPYGWLITLGLDLKLTLFNPLTRSQFRLPPQPTFPVEETDTEEEPEEEEEPKEVETPEDICRHFLTKFALSSDPSESGDSVVIMALFGGRSEFAFATPTHKAWTHVKCSFSANYDVTFFKGRFYSISVGGELRVCDLLDTREPEAKDIAGPPSGMYMCGTMYLVVFSDNLHLIVRRSVSVDGHTFAEYHHDTVEFYVYRFDFDRSEWVDVQDIDGHALFVGNNTTFALSSSDYPEFKSNTVYFTDDNSDSYERGFCDMGVYDFGSKAVIKNLQSTEDLVSKISRPFFFMPSLSCRSK